MEQKIEFSEHLNNFDARVSRLKMAGFFITVISFFLLISCQIYNIYYDKINRCFLLEDENSNKKSHRSREMMANENSLTREMSEYSQMEGMRGMLSNHELLITNNCLEKVDSINQVNNYLRKLISDERKATSQLKKDVEKCRNNFRY